MHEHPGPLSRHLLTIGAAMVLIAAGPGRAGAQVSPGPLARAHASLDRPTLCFKCHARAGGMTARCLACHTGIAAQRARGTGIHGRETRAKDCAGCHPDHAGVAFDLVHWEEGRAEAFDHRRAGLTLTGKHATITCVSCHQAKFRRAVATEPAGTPEPAHRWMGLDPACASCHQDPHRARFGNQCARCHGTDDWKRVESTRFDHDLTRYPLRGKHATVRCEACHDPAAPAGARPAFATCGACHRDAHAGQGTLAGRPADCEACHDLTGFRGTTFTVAMHARTGYPLEGRHATVACEACHAKRPPGPATSAAFGPAGVPLHPPHERCASCHANVHGTQTVSAGDLRACERCHRVTGWTPSTLRAADHRGFRFALDGAHARAACRACHAVKRPGLAPLPGPETVGTAAFAFDMPERECVACHADPHQGRYAANGARPLACLACHDTEHWRPSRVDAEAHRTYAFPLEGAHRAVPCTGCHSGLRARASGPALVLAAHGPPLALHDERTACAACHTDPHGGQFAARRERGACEACHGLEAWRPASRFVHDRDSRFKLEGAHARIACAACHATTTVAGTRRVTYQGVPTACASCHAGARSNGGT